MKSLFSTIMNNSLFNFAKRLAMAIISISISISISAGGNTFYANVTFTPQPTGGGTVYADNSEKSTSTSGGNIDFILTISPNDGYYFKELKLTNEVSGTHSWSLLDYTLTVQSSTTKSELTSKNALEYKFDAYFKDYVYGYSNGRTAKIYEGADFGVISLDNNNWDTNVTADNNGEVKTLRQKGDQITNEADKITLTYYAKPLDEFCYFEGWHLKKDDIYQRATVDEKYLQTTFSYDFYPTSKNIQSPSKVPTLYAKFGKKALFRDRAVAQVVIATEEGYYDEETTSIEQALAGKVYIQRSSETIPSEEKYQTPSFTLGEGAITPINDESGKYYYTYYALAKSGYIFVGWATVLEGVDGKIEIIKDAKGEYTHPHFSSEKDMDKAPYPDVLYAVFRKNTYYHFKGAIAEFTENGEKGQLTVTGYTLDDNDETLAQVASTLQGHPKESMDKIDDSGSTYQTELNIRKYKYTYKATDTDPEGQNLTAFKGWSRSPLGGSILSTENPYDVIYTTYATHPDHAAETAPIYAIFQSYWYKDPSATAVGGGQVAVTYSDAVPEENSAEWKQSISASSIPNQVAAEEEQHKYSVWYHAKGSFGTDFKGWSYVNDVNAETFTDHTVNPYKADYSVTATDDKSPFVPARLYAIFGSVIKVIQQDRMIYHVDEHGNKNINDANVIINFNEAATLTATLKDNHDIFQLSDKKNVQKGTSITLDASSGMSHMVVSYIGQTPAEHIGKTATITLSSTYTDDEDNNGTASIDVVITIEEKPFVTFLPTDGKGSYTIQHTDGRGIDYVMPKEATENIYVSVAQENMSTFELSLTEDVANDGLTFAGWQMIVNDVASYFSYDKKCTYTFKESAYVRPVFLADDRAVFTIDGDPTERLEYRNKYYDLQQALNDAKKVYGEKNETQVVVFSNEGKQTGTLYQGDYAIPSGVVLLIPGVGPGDDIAMKEADEDKYVYRLKHIGELNGEVDVEIALTTNDYFNISAVAKAFRKLYVEDNTMFTVESGGCLYVYSALNHSGQTYEARPYRYGQIILGENCQINVESGAELYAFGFITGAESSNVTAQTGANVYEIFQYSDPRGGTGVAHLFICRNYYRVFPFSQFYVQNVEVPMELKGGSIEYIITTADIMSNPYVVMTPFVIPETNNKDATGLFQLSNNTSLIKYYDPLNDRLNIIIKGMSANESTAKLGSIKIQMGDLGSAILGETLNTIASFGKELLPAEITQLITDVNNVKLDSRDYVLPLNHNMDISIENAKFSVSSSFAFLAGSTLTIDEKSTLELETGARMYLYDAVDNYLPEALRRATNSGDGGGLGYFASTNELLIPVFGTPNNTHLNADGKTKKRTSSALKDAQWIVNGIVNVHSGAGLYTTNNESYPGEHARIISTQKGQVYFETKVNDTKTYQAKYMGKTGADALLSVNRVYDAKINMDNELSAHKRAVYDVTSAKLQNADGSYEDTEANTYFYHPDKGRWLNTAPEHMPLEGAEVCVTLPESWPITLTSKLNNVNNATISWNGDEAKPVTSISSDAKGLHINLLYESTNKAGEYEGVINIDNSYYQRVTVIEDYTPHFSTIESWFAYGYPGYSSEVNASIIPEIKNVAGILDGDYKSTWSYKITGDNADEFRFEFGEGASLLSDAKIVFRPRTTTTKIKKALLSLTCSYTDAASTTHSTCVNIPLQGQIVSLDPNTLAFAKGIESIFISSDEQDLFANINSDAKITITPAENEVVTIASQEIDGKVVYKIKPKAQGSVTITATQEADLVNKIAATTISKTITVTDDIVWNWKHLYFGTTLGTPYGTPPVSHHEQIEIVSIEISDNHHYKEYDEAGNLIREYDDDGDRHDVVQSFTQSDNSGYKDVISIAGWEEGETEVYFRVLYRVGDDDEIQGDGDDDPEYKSEVYRDPRYLPFTVNDDRIYEAVTWAQTGINHTDGDVTFKPATGAVAQWTLTFKGIPDLLTFNAQGKGMWQIEESHNGTNWSITHTWANIASSAPFEMELQPATRFVRISYGQGDAKGILSNVTVSELKSVRADVNKLYMPIISPNNSSKNVVFTYVSEDGFTLETGNKDLFTTNPSTLRGLATDPYYVIEQVNVEMDRKASTPMVDALNVKGGDLTIPIQTFTFPQAIPIQLASDHQERYYYVTTNTYNTVWDMDNRQIVMHNAVADASPYVVFHFADSPVPGIISFSYPVTAKGIWLIEESANGSTGWTEMAPNEAEDLTKQFVMRDFSYPEASRYVRITYLSDYAEIIELSNLAILPTSNVTVNPSELIVYDTQNEMLSVTANNLQQVSFELPTGFAIMNENEEELSPDALSSMFKGNGTKKDEIYIQYSGSALATYGDLVISTTKDAQGATIDKKVLAVVHLTGLKKNLPVGASGIYTGTALDIAGFDKNKEAYRREINTQNAFAGENALFNYVIIYGETRTTDESNTITAPTSTAGSNAQTPCYIYQKNGDNYELLSLVENANSSTKSWNGAMTVPDNHSLKVYITGFCPYASTGYSKSDEGVWYFTGTTGDKIDIYLEDCYIYSRYKSKRGNSFSRNNGETYSDKVVRGSGAVLLFANTNKDDAQTESMDVTIHTRGTNLLKSHYGCLFESIVGRAFQISSPVQIYMQSPAHYNNSFSTLTFDDKWPTATTEENGVFTSTERTNGFLSLQKQVNNAPSIDMGNKKTVVNFRGGRIELQNALNSSDNYESTLAISYRTGTYGPAKFRFTLSHGIGTDGTEGRVNFYDGTTTVKSMTVPERYRQYYLMDENGTTTSCLRSQKNTFVYGGSHCMMRACPEPTDKGGAPTDGDVELQTITDEQGVEERVEVITGNPLGLCEYTLVTEGETPDVVDGTTQLATINNFPGDLEHSESHKKLSEVHKGYPKVHESDTYGRYGLESVTPKNNTLQFWIPAGYVQGVAPEVNNKISYWKACMTYIEAKYGPYEGNIGGMTEIAFNDDEQQIEEVYNLVYCEIDNNIADVIAATGDEQYYAPVLNPAPTEKVDEKYMQIPPTTVGTGLDQDNPVESKNYITNTLDYIVKDKLYYIVPAQADVWMAFTAPFDVAKIYIMETRHEQDLHKDAIALLRAEPELDYRNAMLKSQAKHNADFAAFFGVALALESTKPFEDIFADYIGWANWKDDAAKRNKYELVHYYNTYDINGNLETSNWYNADYYLYKNTGDWELTQSEAEGNQRFITQWEFVAPPAKGQALLKQGETYSMLFPYCTGCGDDLDSRDYWDYWTGKFLIFESTDGGEEGHRIKGSASVGSTYEDNAWAYTDDGLISTLKESNVKDNVAVLTGNPTFAKMNSIDNNVLAYSAEFDSEGFTLQGQDIEPTQSFLYTNIVAITSSGQSLLGIGRDGTIRYGGNNSGNQNGTSGLTPTVGGGNDMFITAIEGGINIAVAEPQMVKVMSSTGAVLFAGYVTTATDVQLPTHGIYIVSGENEVQKIMH